MNAARKNGFSLIELMVTIAAASIVSLTVVLILFLGWLSWRSNGEQVRLQSDMALAVRMMAHEIRLSRTNDLSVSGSTLTLAQNDVRPYTAGFIRDGNSLTRTINGADSGVLILRGVNSFQPVLQTNGVLLELVLQTTNTFLPVSITNKTFINTRNKP